MSIGVVWEVEGISLILEKDTNKYCIQTRTAATTRWQLRVSSSVSFCVYLYILVIRFRLQVSSRHVCVQGLSSLMFL
jgi:hypothetical protein